MTIEAVVVGSLVLAALPAILALLNLPLYRPPAREFDRPLPPVSVLIPARNEAGRIGAAIRSVLSNRGVDLELLVMDDHSIDGTAEIVRAVATSDPRVRLETAPELPAGWAGKPHACQALADRSSAPILFFIDADVELAPDGIARSVGELEARGADLLSGFPLEITRTPMEKLVLPLIHFVLLGYLPLIGMRYSRMEAFAAGCGQLMIARRDAYRAAGGHAAVRGTFHDGLKLPRAFRRAGLRTALFDATTIARCRMYASAAEVVQGLAKNAHEGMAGPLAIWVWSILLLGGAVVPALLVIVGTLPGTRAPWLAPAWLALALGIGIRLLLAIRFRQSILGALLHSLGVALLVGIQWYAWFRRRFGAELVWKERRQARD